MKKRLDKLTKIYYIILMMKKETVVNQIQEESLRGTVQGLLLPAVWLATVPSLLGTPFYIGDINEMVKI